MRRYQQADADAAALLVTRISPAIFHYFLRQVRDRSQAEDLLQDFWLRIHNARHTYRPAEPLLPWAFAIARRVKIDEYRRSSRITKHEVPSEGFPEGSARPSESSPGLVADLLKTLPPAQREALLLLKVAGLSLDEVARTTGTSVGAVKQKAHRAYASLRKLFGNEL